MARYEYECPQHGKFEIERSISEPTLREVECPVCKEKARRVFSPPGIVFRWAKGG
jgi:putative FmdB family regulatory protein